MKVKFLAATHFEGVDYEAGQVVDFEDLRKVRDLVLAHRIEVPKGAEARETAMKNPARETRGETEAE